MQNMHIRMILCAATALTMMLTLFNTLPVQAGAADSIACAQQIVNRMNRDGFRIRTDVTNWLNQDYYRDYTVTLYRGVSYVLFACGDAAARDVDIYLYDENGNLIDRDHLRDARPVVEVTPRWTGPFRIRVKMYDSYRGGPAYYTLAVMYR